jgi:signal transduction histidine kinase
MRIKTFLLTYLLFLCILFSSLGIVSVYLTNSQMNMLKEKSIKDYQTISATLAREIAVLYGRNAGMSGMNFSEAVESFIHSYSRYYNRYNIDIALIDLSLQEEANDNCIDADISFITREQEHFVYINGILPEPFQFYRLDYHFKITQNIADMKNIQHTLLIFAIMFSVITALALYLILLRIFKPLGIVAKTSRKIANGEYGERIHIKGKNELSSMAFYFNRMAGEIEKHIRLLEEEAIKKQEFIDNFAHEIRTPLTSIYGYAEYLQKAPLNEKENIESTHFIMGEANHIKNIANSLLELATLRNYTAVKNKIYMQPLFENISQTMKKSLDEKNIRLVCKSDIEILEGQEDLIKSLLLNLCFNAIKSCSRNDGVIYMEAKEQEANIVLSVRDNGCGISDENLIRITEPFYRADKARNREQGGAGLGLTLCKQIAEAHGAEMSIESFAGTGTTVKISFTTP